MAIPVILRSPAAFLQNARSGATKNPSMKRFFASLRMTKERYFETVHKKKSLKGKKVLITCGPTWVPIDSVRVISNRSTGEMGHLIAKELKRLGAQVTLIEGPVTHQTDLKFVRVIKFRFYDELIKILKEQLKKKYDVIIHAAAVSDYRMKKILNKKIDSQQAYVDLRLVPTEKIIDWIKRLNPEAFLVGFKLGMDVDLNELKQKTAALFKKANCDLVVANSFSGQHYQGYIMDKQSNILFEGKNREDISKRLVNMLNAKCHCGERFSATPAPLL